MPRSFPLTAAELRGLTQLATSATLGVTNIVESMHHTITTPWALFSKQSPRRMGGVAGLVYKTIRGTTRAIGGGTALGLGVIQRATPTSEKNLTKLALVSALNGVVGDHLAATHNPLAIAMQWRVGDGFTAKGGKLLVLVHGLCMNDHQWLHQGHDHGAVLANALGATPIYVRYNTGLPIEANGAQFDALLEKLVGQWPDAVKEIIVVAHSMGGLVTRAACVCAQAHEKKSIWRGKLKHIVFLGTPHAGAPLERGGHWVDLLLGAIPFSSPFARLTTVRSAGITDLRTGNTTHPLPSRVKCYAIAASLAAKRGGVLDRLAGDGLVPLASALGGGVLKFHETHVLQGAGHLDLLSDPRATQQMKAWLTRKR